MIKKPARVQRVFFTSHSMLTVLGFVSAMGFVLAAPSWSRAASSAGESTTVERLSEEAMAKYEAKDFAGAIAVYLQAYQVQPAGALLYNIATIYDKKLNQRDPAIEYYRRYLSSTDADPELVRKTVARLQVLENARTAAASAPGEGGVAGSAPVATAQAKGPFFTKERTQNLGIVVTAVGVVGVGTGLFFGYKAKSANDDANKLCEGTTCYSDEGIKLSEDAVSWATRSTIVTAAGLTVAAVGVAMIVLPKVKPQWFAEHPVSVVPVVSDRGAGVVLSASF